MTPEELARHDGKDGRPAYIAVNGTIYDVTASPRWKDGLHPPDHYAGRDLTEDLATAPHVRAVVERFPVVGSLEESPAAATASGGGGKITIGIVIVAVIVAVILFLAL